MNVCPTCGELFDHGHVVCALDSTRLVAWSSHLPQDETTEVETDVDLSFDRSLLPAPPEVGRTLCGRYALRAQIGVGGFGVVFAADDTRLQKRVAVKVLSPRLARRPAAMERFRREALAASAVRHENIIDVTDFDMDSDGTQLIVMEYLDGLDLAEVIRRDGPFEPARALHIAAQAASALGAAHAAGILHRDLKPANVYVTDTDSRSDFVKILDFGIAKMAQLARGDDSSEGVMGTPHYMSCEQARGHAIDARADVYALGVILYESLVGRPPFIGRTVLEILTNAASTSATPPSTARPQLTGSLGLDALVLRALARDRNSRYSTMAEFGAEIVAELRQRDPILAEVVNPRQTRLTRSMAGSELVSTASSSTLDDSSGELQDAITAGSGRWRRFRRVGLIAAVCTALAAAGAVAAVRSAARDTPAAIGDGVARRSLSAPPPGATPTPGEPMRSTIPVAPASPSSVHGASAESPARAALPASRRDNSHSRQPERRPSRRAPPARRVHRPIPDAPGPKEKSADRADSAVIQYKEW